MRDDHGGAVVAGEERLEPRQSLEVEVVRRLVEQEHVDAGEQDRGERRAGRLAAREPVERPVERDREPELRQRRGGPRVEVAAAAGEEGVEGVGVPGGELRLGGEAARERVHPLRRGGDAGAALEVGAQRLVPERVPLLGQVPDGERGGVRRTAPRSGSSSPASRRSSVDLPAPFGPTSPMRACGGTTRSTSARTTWAPCDFEIPAATSVPDGRGMREPPRERAK